MQNRNRKFLFSLGWISALVLALLISTNVTGVAHAQEALIGQESQVIQQTNTFRQSLGLNRLEPDQRLSRSAQAKAEDLAEKSYFTHEDENGNRMGYWIYQQDYDFDLAGENLARGFDTVSEMFEAWKESPTHRENLAEPTFEDIGVGMARGTYEGKETIFVVQHFGVEEETASQPTETSIDEQQAVPAANAESGSSDPQPKDETRRAAEEPAQEDGSIEMSQEVVPEEPQASPAQPSAIEKEVNPQSQSALTPIGVAEARDMAESDVQVQNIEESVPASEQQIALILLLLLVFVGYLVEEIDELALIREFLQQNSRSNPNS